MKGIPLTEYILRSREDRTTHIDLGSPCECRGKKEGKQNNNQLFAALCLLHGIENDVPNRARAGIHTCHLCSEHHCKNHLHAYIGTHSENCLDVPAEVRAEIARKRVATMELRGTQPKAKRKAAPKVKRKAAHLRKRLKSRRAETLRFTLSSLGVVDAEIERVLQASPLPGLVDALRSLG